MLIDASGHSDKEVMHKLAWLHKTLVKLKPIIILYKWWYKRELAILRSIKPWTPFCVLSIFWRVLQLCQEPNITLWCVLYVWSHGLGVGITCKINLVGFQVLSTWYQNTFDTVLNAFVT